MSNDYKPSKLADIFDNLELPDAQMPLHKQRLKRALLENGSFNRKPAHFFIHNVFLRPFFFIRQHSAYSLAAIALFITVALWSVWPFSSPAFAHIILEINPALKLTVNADNNVIDFEALDQPAKDIFEKSDFRRKRADLAIEEILNLLHEKTLLRENSSVMLVVTPVRDEKIADIEQTKSKAEMTVNRRLAELNTALKVRTLTLKTKVYSAAEEAGLRPSQYVRLLDYGMTTDTLREIFHYADDPEVNKDYFVNNFDEIAEQITVALDKDVPEDATVSMFREALAARRKGEFRRAVRRLNELLDENLTPKAAAAQIRDEIRSRRNINNVEERNDEDKVSEDIDDGYDQEILEDKNEQPSGNGMDRNPNEAINERRERQNERRERLDERHKRQQQQRERQENGRNEQPDKESEESNKTSEDSFEQSDKEQEQPDETRERSNIRRNRQNIRQQHQDTSQERRNERMRRQNPKHQRRNEEQKQPDKSKK